MARRRGTVAVLALAGCGRIGFGVLAAGDGPPGPDASPDAPADAAMPGPVCAGLADICGPAGTSPCCTSPLVPGGTFYRSYDHGADGMFTAMTDPATVGDFRLDAYEVTVARFRAFVAAGAGTQASPPAAGAGARTLNGVAGQAGWDPTWNASLPATTADLETALLCQTGENTWTSSPGPYEAMPITCLDWYLAFAFCAWDGGYLPTIAEWNYAGAGGGDQRAYPWSSPASSLVLDCQHANYDPTPFCVNDPNGFPSRVGSESPAGDGKWGHSDLAGNVWEWLLDWSVAYANPCTDCAALTGGSQREFRGGSYFDVTARMRPALRNSETPDSVFSDFGVRCARLP